MLFFPLISNVFISLIGLSRLIKIGRREIKIKNPGACHLQKQNPKKLQTLKIKSCRLKQSK
jgi:hypothetical protein